MQYLKLKTTLAALSVGAMFAFSGAASAATVFSIDVTDGSLFSTNSPATGSTAKLDFSFAQSGSDVDLTVATENTTGSATFGSGATESRLMGFAFETPDLVSLVSFTGSTIFSELLTNDGSVNGGPFNSIIFDLGAGNKSSLLGGGNPNGALAQGSSTSVTFKLSGLGESAMASAFETGFSSGSLELGLRFKAVNGSGADSDKLLYRAPDPTPVPLPAAAWMLLAGLGGLAAMKRRKSA